MPRNPEGPPATLKQLRHTRRGSGSTAAIRTAFGRSPRPSRPSSFAGARMPQATCSEPGCVADGAGRRVRRCNCRDGADGRLAWRRFPLIGSIRFRKVAAGGLNRRGLDYSDPIAATFWSLAGAGASSVRVFVRNGPRLLVRTKCARATVKRPAALPCRPSRFTTASRRAVPCSLSASDTHK
jgi:hypothetical protein